MGFQSAIHTACEIDQKIKQVGFNQEALDQIARQGFANTKFEMAMDEGFDVVEVFYQGDEQQVGIDCKFLSIQQELKESLKLIN